VTAKRRRLGLATRAIHGDPKARPDWTAVAPPLYQSSTFTNPVGSSAEVLYSRYGNNPNQIDIGKRLALLEGAEAALFVASGMGAAALAHLAVLRPGDHLLSSEWIYGGVHRLFNEEFGRLGIDVSFVNPTATRTWKKAMRKTTRAVFIETPTNPLMRVIDLEPVATLCKAEGLALIVDSTFASPVNFRPLEHGADIVIHSATKYLNGHTDVIAGAVVGTEQVVEEVRRLMQVWGQALDPFAAWLLLRGPRTLPLRIARQNQTALETAKFLEQHPVVARVHYPGLESHPQHDLACRQMPGGFGGLMSFELRGGLAAAQACIGNMRIPSRAVSFGGFESLATQPAAMWKGSIGEAKAAEAGISDGLIRLSIGLEHPLDLIADLDRALHAAN